MKKNYTDEKSLRLRRIRMKAVKKKSDKNLVPCKIQTKNASKLTAVIQALSWGTTKEEIEKKLIYFNRVCIKNLKT